MPWGFPSHQGLVLPLWARWPKLFHGLALCVGAAVPDIIDGTVGIARGRLGQGIGHSLVGLALLSIPVGLVSTGLIRKAWRRFAPRPTKPHSTPSWFDLLDDERNTAPKSRARFWPAPGDFLRQSGSIFVGAVSHVLFDFVSHDTFGLLRPWYENPTWFPEWWRHQWGAVDLLVYEKPYPIAPHTLVWFVLSIVGAWLYVRLLRQRASRFSETANDTARSAQQPAARPVR